MEKLRELLSLIEQDIASDVFIDGATTSSAVAAGPAQELDVPSL